MVLRTCLLRLLAIWFIVLLLMGFLWWKYFSVCHSALLNLRVFRSILLSSQWPPCLLYLSHQTQEVWSTFYSNIQLNFGVAQRSPYVITLSMNTHVYHPRSYQKFQPVGLIKCLWFPCCWLMRARPTHMKSRHFIRIYQTF